ncbi:MAG: thioredoxin [Aureliella sp.]
MSDASSGSWVVNVTDADFQQTVDAHSSERLVLVDFWAEWCAPCRALGPVLESLAKEYAGRFVLLKAETEHAQATAGQFGVSGIPAVFAVSSGETIDSFQGAMPEPEIRKWLDRLLDGDPIAQALELAESDLQTAEEQLQQIANQDASQAEAVLALTEVLVRAGKLEEATTRIEQLESRGFLEPEGERLKAKIALQYHSSIDVEEARRKLSDSPDDLPAKLRLAHALAGASEYSSALQTALEIVEADFGDFREQARQLMVQIFYVLPDGDPLTHDYRRQLSLALY